MKMRKIINPCVCDTYTRTGKIVKSNGFVKIEFDGKRLSMSGAIGPRSNGNCAGSAGQCVDEIRRGTPNNGWTREMLDRLCDIWERWHLNDMRPECEHQRELGWPEQASENITLYRYSLKRDARKMVEDAEKAALDALINGETFTPTKEQVFAANLNHFLYVYDEIGSELEPYYEPYKSVTGRSDIEQKTRGWIDFNKCDKGILGKPCPVCGYRYGSSWILEEVPEDVLKWLDALPDTKIEPAWV